MGNGILIFTYYIISYNCLIGEKPNTNNHQNGHCQIFKMERTVRHERDMLGSMVKTAIFRIIVIHFQLFIDGQPWPSLMPFPPHPGRGQYHFPKEKKTILFM
jgi:hypothetical protein